MCPAGHHDVIRYSAALTSIGDKSATAIIITMTNFSLAAALLLVLAAAPISNAFTLPASSSVVHHKSPVPTTSALYGKKKKGSTPRPNPNYSSSKKGQQQQEKASVKEARFDAATRQFMFTLVGLTKTLPDKSKDILKNINLSFYPGAKIGVVGLNGSGKSTLLKIMAGVEKEFDGIARPLPGASIGYLPQEPVLEYETVQECIDAAVASSKAILDEYNELSMSMANPDITDEEMTSAMNKLETIGNKIEAENLWELDRMVERAMDSLRVPPGDAKTAVLSGGEKRRVSLCQLLLGSHDMLLLDEPTNHLVRTNYICDSSHLFLSYSHPFSYPQSSTVHSVHFMVTTWS
jgi:ABC-type Mn2+/Zn2+ transport system ATPase subunit